MAVTLLLAREKPHHNSIVTLLGSLERENLADRCEIRLALWDRIVGEYEQAATGPERCVIGFSLTTPDVARFVKLMSTVRQVRRPGDLVVAGGPHASAADEAVLALGVDVVFRGEADRSFPLFMRAILGGDEWRDLPGLSRLDGSRLVRNPAAEPIEMDRVRSRSDRMRLLGSLEITRGCPYGCGFCQTARFWGCTPRHRSLENILEELVHYRASRFVRLLAPNAFGYCAEQAGEPNIRAIIEMLEAAHTRHPMVRIVFGAFPSEVRPEYVRRELVRAVRPLVSNRYLAVGAQSGSDRVLALAGRGHTVADVLRACETILDEGMGVLVDTLFGLPGETADDRAQTRRMMAQIASWGGRFRVHIFWPLPGTPLANAPAAPLLDPDTSDFLSDMARRGAAEGTWKTNAER